MAWSRIHDEQEWLGDAREVLRPWTDHCDDSLHPELNYESGAWRDVFMNFLGGYYGPLHKQTFGDDVRVIRLRHLRRQRPSRWAVCRDGGVVQLSGARSAKPGMTPCMKSAHSGARVPLGRVTTTMLRCLWLLTHIGASSSKRMRSRQHSLNK